MRIMSYNIHAGIGIDGKYNLDRIADSIRQSDPDVIGLQEVDRHYDSRSNYEDLAGRLADELSMHYAFMATAWKSPVSESAGQPRMYGLAVLSKYPIIAEKPRLFTDSSGPRNQGLLETQIDAGGHVFYFYVTHWGLEVPVRLAQAAETLKWMEERSGPKLIVGDFNATPEAPEIGLMSGVYQDAFAGEETSFTFKTNSPTKRIDYIFGDGLTYRNRAVICSRASDHLPIIAEVVFDEPPV